MIQINLFTKQNIDLQTEKKKFIKVDSRGKGGKLGVQD